MVNALTHSLNLTDPMPALDDNIRTRSQDPAPPTSGSRAGTRPGSRAVSYLGDRSAVVTADPTASRCFHELATMCRLAAAQLARHGQEEVMSSADGLGDTRW